MTNDISVNTSDLVVVQTKASRRNGIAYPPKPTEYWVRITGKVANVKIEIFKETKDGMIHCRDFVLGDEAERDSYNLSYTGLILGITKNSVTISHHRNAGPAGEKHRLSLYEFCWRNYKFDAEKTRNSNSETMNYL